MEEIIKTAGVTFTNDDGESRQEILKTLGENTYITVNLLKKTFIPESGKPELAIACVERNSKKQIGYIPRVLVKPELLKLRQLTGFIGLYKDRYFCEMTRQQAPDREMHDSVKKICEARGLPMPAYDVRAYCAFSESLQV